MIISGSISQQPSVMGGVIRSPAELLMVGKKKKKVAKNLKKFVEEVKSKK
jgi:hypothetical protein